MTRSRSDRGRALAPAVVAGLALLACSAPGPPPRPSETDHAQSSAELRARMRELQTLSRTRLPRELDLGVEKEQRRRELVEAADALAAAALELARSGPPEALSPEQAARFRAHAESLRDRALDVAGEARSADPGDLAAPLDALYATCGRCHRELGVPPVAP